MCQNRNSSHRTPFIKQIVKTIKTAIQEINKCKKSEFKLKSNKK